MKNLWPESFKESDFEDPEAIFEQQAKLLSKLTGDLVYAEVIQLDPLQAHVESMKNDFSYGFYIKGKFLTNYSYRVLSFSHDITFYPIELNVDSEIKKELNIEHKLVKVESPEQVESFLQTILRSDRVSRVIGAIIKLTK